MSRQGSRVSETVGDIKKRLDAIMPRSFSRAAATAYSKGFAASGERKADSILTEINKYDLPLKQLVFVSIGGSTGSEAIRVLQHSPIELAILLESSNSAVDVARKNSKSLRRGKTLQILCGDATQKLPELREQLQEWRDKRGVQGVIVSIQAVLHELPARSPGFSLRHFLGELFWNWPVCLFFCRETCSPPNWPEFVRLRCKGLSSETLEEFAVFVRNYLSIPGDTERQGPEVVRMPSSLAIEVLTKIFYWSEFAHEIEESVTAITIDQLVDAVRSFLGPNSVTQRELTSESFNEFYRAFEVMARDDSDRPLETPRCFIQITGERLGRYNRIRGAARPQGPESDSLTNEISRLKIPERLRDAIRAVIIHPEYPQFMSVGGKTVRNPVWNSVSPEELIRFRDTYEVDGPTPPQVIHLDMFLVRKNDSEGKAQLYTYFSHDWDADLIPFRHRTSQDLSAKRAQSNAAVVGKIFGVSAETISVSPLPGQFAVSLKPHAKYKDLVLYVFEFCSVKLPANVTTHSEARWRTLRSLRSDAQLEGLNGDVIRAVRELFGHDLAFLPEST